MSGQPSRRGGTAARIIALIAVVLAAVILGNMTTFGGFPDPGEPKAMKYDWEYGERQYSMTFTVYGSIDDYYENEPKGIFIGREEASLEKYIELSDEDESISDLTTQIKELATANGLDEDETLEMAVAFVQDIPYDFDKAKTDREHPRYPYEVLFDNKGICSDKSFLMYAILREMGYGGAVFEYEKESHMNVGVQSPVEYSTDNSGYSMIETTNPKVKIGVVPSLDTESGQAVKKRALAEFNLRNPNVTIGKQLSSPSVYAKTTGNRYSGMIETFQNQREIADIQDYLEGQEPIIEEKQARLEALMNEMERLEAAGDIRAYNAMVPRQNRMVNELNELVDDFNDQVNRYNDLIKKL